MSINGPPSSAMNDAVRAAYEAGVLVIVAAGNHKTNACDKSPSQESVAFTVGATVVEDAEGVQTDERADFSNWGACVDLFAPGDLVQSDWIGSNTAARSMSGTSMAAPHVAGMTALYLRYAHQPTYIPTNHTNSQQTHTPSPKQQATALLEKAQTGKIDINCEGPEWLKIQCEQTPNKMMHSLFCT
eukprot:TRINITY_DN61159_c0_g1_i3.p1 TRINITY_DN61159_c0_g1~~TRINITY_DN61159_c0_g1_i3.p1  ORF type:complete len:186 (+),score=28.95 TRINITY_DN61159_c0_g1_i3:336-893(+)